jgi:adenylate kinase
MKEKVNAKFLKLALDLMNDQQLKHFALELEDRMEQLKTKLIENNNEEFAVDIREEYVVLKDIHCIIIT